MKAVTLISLCLLGTTDTANISGRARAPQTAARVPIINQWSQKRNDPNSTTPMAQQPMIIQPRPGTAQQPQLYNAASSTQMTPHRQQMQSQRDAQKALAHAAQASALAKGRNSSPMTRNADAEHAQWQAMEAKRQWEVEMQRQDEMRKQKQATEMQRQQRAFEMQKQNQAAERQRQQGAEMQRQAAERQKKQEVEMQRQAAERQRQQEAAEVQRQNDDIQRQQQAFEMQRQAAERQRQAAEVQRQQNEDIQRQNQAAEMHRQRQEMAAQMHAQQQTAGAPLLQRPQQGTASMYAQPQHSAPPTYIQPQPSAPPMEDQPQPGAAGWHEARNFKTQSQEMQATQQLDAQRPYTQGAQVNGSSLAVQVVYPTASTPSPQSVVPVVSEDFAIQTAVKDAASHKTVNIGKAISLFSSLYSLQKNLPQSMAAINTVMQGSVLAATTTSQIALFSVGNIGGLMGIASKLQNNPYGVSTWMFILTLASLQLSGMGAVIPVFTTVVNLLDALDFRNIIFNSYAGIQVSGFFGRMYSSITDKFARMITAISRGIRRVTLIFKTPQEEKQFGEATAQTIKLVQRSSFTHINLGEYREFKNMLADHSDCDDYVSLIEEAIASSSEGALYILLRRLGKYTDLEDSHMDDIVKLVDSPLISGSFSAMIFQDDRFGSFYADKMLGVSFYHDLAYFAEMYYSLAKRNVNEAVRVLEVLNENQSLIQAKQELNCIFFRLTFRDCNTQCNMKSIIDKFKNMEKFAEALNIVVKKSLISGRIMKENHRRSNQNLYSSNFKDRSNQLNMAKSLLDMFRENYKQLLEKNLHSLIDMSILLGEDNDKRALKEWIDGKVSPVVHGIYLASIKPSLDTLPADHHTSEPNQFLTSVYRHLLRNPIKYPGSYGRNTHGHYEAITLEYNEGLEIKLLGKVDKQFAGRTPETKTAIVDLVIRLFLNIHPDKMPALRPMAHLSFLKQLKKRIGDFNKIQDAKATLKQKNRSQQR